MSFFPPSSAAPDSKTEHLFQKFVALSTHHRSVIDELRAKADSFRSVRSQLEDMPLKLSHPVMVPLVDDLAYVPGRLVRTNEVLCLLGDNYFVWRSAHDAKGIVDRHLHHVERNLQSEEQKLRRLNEHMGLLSTAPLVSATRNESLEERQQQHVEEDGDEGDDVVEIKEEEQEALQRESRLSRGRSYQVVQNRDGLRSGGDDDHFEDMFNRLALEEEEEEQMEEEEGHLGVERKSGASGVDGSKPLHEDVREGVLDDADDDSMIAEFNKYFKQSGGVGGGGGMERSLSDSKNRRVTFSELPPSVAVIPPAESPVDLQPVVSQQRAKPQQQSFTGIIVERQRREEEKNMLRQQQQETNMGNEQAPKRVSRFKQRMMEMEHRK